MQNIIERRIGWGDLDALGIVFYPRYYEWIDAAGHSFFDAVGLNLNGLKERRGVIFGLAETGCRYLKPGRYHQRIRIVTTIRELDEKALILGHRIEDAQKKELMVEGFEKRVCMDVSDPENFKSIVIPDDIRNRLSKEMEAMA